MRFMSDDSAKIHVNLSRMDDLVHLSHAGRDSGNMADLHVFPIRTSNTEQLDRLYAELLSAYEEQIDVGPRQIHMDQIMKTLLQLSQDLKKQIDHPDFATKSVNKHFQPARNSLLNLVDKISKLSDLVES